MPTTYGNDTLICYLFLPKRGIQPFQTIIYWPASNAFRESHLQTKPIDFLLKTGRAVMYPIYKGMHERRFDQQENLGTDRSRHYRIKERRIKQIQDLKRAIDYLESRDDIQVDKLAYMGISLGGALGPIALATEKRLKAGVLIVAGFTSPDLLPEVDELNYLPSVIQPVLMMNGEYDSFFEIETNQKPFFNFMGTPPEHKNLLLFPEGHQIPKVALIKETLGWLDTYLGPVNY